MLLMTLIGAFTITGAVSCVAWPAALLLGVTAGSQEGGSLALALAALPGGGTDTGNIQTEPDTTAPYVIESTPSDEATAVAPNPGTITVVFNEAMDTSLTPTLTTKAYDGSAYVDIPSTGTTITWTSATTLKISLSWVQFPENTKIQWTLGAANLKDTAGNVMEGDVNRTFTTSSRNIYFAIADTGQASCYYDDGGGTWIEDTNCSQSYSSGSSTHPPRQDAHFLDTPNARSFTGPTEHPIYAGNYTTTDNVTGLVWKTCSEGQSGPSCTTGSASLMSWYDAVNACAALNTANGGAGYAGRTSWRLPASAELESLVDYGISSSPVIDATAFPGTKPFNYWSASANFLNLSAALPVYFGQGTVFSYTKGSNMYVRCVSGP